MSVYAGAVGEKITITGTVARLLPSSQYYGTVEKTSMLVFVEAGRTVATMFTSASWAFDVEQGDTVTIAGTVKEHSEYRDVKQTVLARPKLIAA